MKVLPSGRRGKANSTCWREVWPTPAGSVYEVDRTYKNVRPAAVTPNTSLSLTNDPARLFMLITLGYFGALLSVAVLALRAVTRYDPDESVPPRLMPNLHGDEEPYPREWE